MPDIKERRAYIFDMRAEQDEERGSVITGRPIVFEQETDLRYFTEKIARGALDKTDLKDVRLLVNHNTDMIPLARSRNNNVNSTMQLMPCDDGLDFRATLDTENNPDARALYSAIQRGDVTGMSFMFSVDGDEWENLDTDHPTRTITSIRRVYEISAVSFPAYEGTSIQAASSADALESAKATLDSARAARAAQTAEADAPEAQKPIVVFERCNVPFVDMDATQLAERAATIAEIDCPEAVEERTAIEAELNARRESAKQAQEAREAVAHGENTTTIRDFKEGKNMPEITEVRASKEYEGAFLRYLHSTNDTECRSLLSTNATSFTGYVPVPTYLENEIKTAWEEHRLLSLVKHTYLKGNVKIGFELTATGAAVHLEGAAAPAEEEITLGVIEIKAESLKKWITVSDEAIEGTTVDTMGYLYKEIAHKITELAEEILVGKITAAPTTSTATAAAVREVELPTAGLALDTIVGAVATLSGQARNLNVAMNRATYAKLVGIQLNAKYAADPFDGLKDRIVFTDKLPGIDNASAGETVIIIGDFGYGAQANFPAGSEMGIKVDNLSLAEKDLVKLVGRMFVGMAVVAENAFVRIKKHA